MILMDCWAFRGTVVPVQAVSMRDWAMLICMELLAFDQRKEKGR